MQQIPLTVNELGVMCHTLGERAYWLRNENIVVIFNPLALGDEAVVIGREGYNNQHYTIEDIVAALTAIR